MNEILPYLSLLPFLLLIFRRPIKGYISRRFLNDNDSPLIDPDLFKQYEKNETDDE